MTATTLSASAPGDTIRAPSTVVLVCTRCRSAIHDPDRPRCGTTLLEAVQDAAKSDPALRVQGVACMSGCTRACVARVLASLLGFLALAVAFRAGARPAERVLLFFWVFFLAMRAT